jgi:phosphoserine phosphatase RsbU/P
VLNCRSQESLAPVNLQHLVMDSSTFSSDSHSRELFEAPAERLFEALMEQSPDRIYIKDLNSRFIAMSRAMMDFFGLRSVEEAIGRTDFDFFSNEHAQQAFDDERRVLETGKPIISREEKETWRDGAVTWASSTKAPLLLSSGKIVGLLGISRDITEQREAQSALRESEKRLREQNKIMNEDFDSARSVQSVMIPGEIPAHSRIATAVKLFPMAAVGGDIITFPPDPEGRLLFFLGDVVGHGVRAALFTVLVKYLTDKLGEKYQGDPQLFLNDLNRSLAGRIPGGFVTGLCGHFEVSETGLTLHISNAGHPELFVYRAKTGEFFYHKLQGGSVLGLPIHAGSPVDLVPLQPGDRIYALTDGVTEATSPSGEEFGVESVLSHGLLLRELDLEQSLGELAARIKKHYGGLEQQDDVSMLAFEVS